MRRVRDQAEGRLGALDDADEFVDLQARAADQAAVHVRQARTVPGRCCLAAAAVEDAQVAGGVLPRAGRPRSRARRRASPGHLRGRRLARADGPHRLVGQHQVVGVGRTPGAAARRSSCASTTAARAARLAFAPAVRRSRRWPSARGVDQVDLAHEVVVRLRAENWRRSLWPTITYWTPASLSMAADTSPVKAPPSWSAQFWAPSSRGSPLAASGHRGDGHEGRADHARRPAARGRAGSPPTRGGQGPPGRGPRFIFQFPATR